MNKTRNFAIVGGVILLAIIAIIVIGVVTPDKPKKSVDFVAVTQYGQEITLHENIGKTAQVLVFFDTEVEGSLDVLERIVANKGTAEVVAVSVNSLDANAQKEKLSDAVLALDKLCFEGEDAISKYNIGNAPVTYFIDIDGYIVNGYIGNIKDQSITKNIIRITQSIF